MDPNVFVKMDSSITVKPCVNHVTQTIVIHVQDLLHGVKIVLHQEKDYQIVIAQPVNMKMQICNVNLVPINVQHVPEVQKVNVFVPKTELESTVTVKITSMMMESMLNVYNVLTDVHNVLIVLLAKLVKVTEFFQLKITVIVQ